METLNTGFTVDIFMYLRQYLLHLIKCQLLTIVILCAIDPVALVAGAGEDLQGMNPNQMAENLAQPFLVEHILLQLLSLSVYSFLPPILPILFSKNLHSSCTPGRLVMQMILSCVACVVSMYCHSQVLMLEN